jgi:hypothetical protein
MRHLKPKNLTLLIDSSTTTTLAQSLGTSYYKVVTTAHIHKTVYETHTSFIQADIPFITLT